MIPFQISPQLQNYLAAPVVSFFNYASSQKLTTGIHQLAFRFGEEA